MMKGAKVVIVEDERVFALHLEKLVTELGYSVIGSYSSGEEVVADLENLEPDMFLMDIKLSGKLDGIDISNTLRKKTDVPIIYISAYNDHELVKRAAKAGPYAYMVKPIDIDVLRTNMELAFGNYNLKRDEQEKKENEIRRLNLKNEELQKNNDDISLAVDELTTTNEHLVTATFREREMKQQLSETLKELELTKEHLESQNIKIRESIIYAETIQGSILPESITIQQIFPDSFIYYVPKDVVSGDFPWLMDKGDDVYIAAVDCTGHGVPGAMMSFVGYFLLNEITGHRKILSPASVLERLHLGVVRTLRQDQEGCRNARDGMDIALCKINLKSMELEYAGAHRPLYLLQDGELIQIKGDKSAIGGTQWKRKKELLHEANKGIENNGNTSFAIQETSESSIAENFQQFTDHKIKIKPGDSVFFFSDGLPDQFGGPEGLKYGPRRIREAIIDNAHLNMSQMHDFFKQDYEAWTENSRQIDDVLLIGIRF